MTEQLVKINCPGWKNVHNRKGRIQEHYPPNCLKVFVIGPNFYAMLRKDQVVALDNQYTEGMRDRGDSPNAASKRDVRSSGEAETKRSTDRRDSGELFTTDLEHRSNSRPKRKRKDSTPK